MEQKSAIWIGRFLFERLLSASASLSLSLSGLAAGFHGFSLRIVAGAANARLYAGKFAEKSIANYYQSARCFSLAANANFGAAANAPV